MCVSRVTWIKAYVPVNKAINIVLKINDRFFVFDMWFLVVWKICLNKFEAHKWNKRLEVFVLCSNNGAVQTKWNAFVKDTIIGQLKDDTDQLKSELSEQRMKNKN